MTTCLYHSDDIRSIQERVEEKIKPAIMECIREIKKDLLKYIGSILVTDYKVNMSIYFKIKGEITCNFYHSYDKHKIVFKYYNNVLDKLKIYDHITKEIVLQYSHGMINMHVIGNFLKFKCKCAGYEYDEDDDDYSECLYNISIEPSDNPQRHVSSIKSVARAIIFINRLLKLTYTPGHNGAERALKRLRNI